MFDGNSRGGGPKHVPSKSIIPRRLRVVSLLLPPASFTVMTGAHWVKAMGATIFSHVPFLLLRSPALAVAASIALGGIRIGVLLCCCKLRKSFS